MTFYPDHQALVDAEAEQFHKDAERAIEEAQVMFEGMTPQDHIRAAEQTFARGDSTEALVHAQLAIAKALINEK